jgi:sporulation protein YunB
LKIKGKRPLSKIKLFVSITTITFAIVVLFMGIDRHLKKIIEPYSTNVAKRIVIAETDATVIEILNEKGISYDKIANLSKDESGKVTSLEIDVEQINALKSNISSRLNEKLSNREDYELKIPVGTILGNEFTIGRGPEITFKMKMSAAVKSNFKSNFYSAGINQVLHQIIIEVQFDGYINIPWFKEGFSDKTDYIAAQTVIVGVVPDAFTNVIESQPQEITGDIFDYSAKNNVP